MLHFHLVEVAEESETAPRSARVNIEEFPSRAINTQPVLIKFYELQPSTINMHQPKAWPQF